jgi:non-ribosomal peptide synthetase component E (peptide arylation enzyme)
MKQFDNSHEEYHRTTTGLDVATVEVHNTGQLRTQHICIQNVIARRAAHLQFDPAVFAWDGGWKYSELHDISSRLASHIQSSNLDFGAVVLLCFERPKCIVTAILPVLRLGHAFALVNLSTTPARIIQICRQTSVAAALTIEAHSESMQTIQLYRSLVDQGFNEKLR